MGLSRPHASLSARSHSPLAAACPPPTSRRAGNHVQVSLSIYLSPSSSLHLPPYSPPPKTRRNRCVFVRATGYGSEMLMTFRMTHTQSETCADFRVAALPSVAFFLSFFSVFSMHIQSRSLDCHHPYRAKQNRRTTRGSVAEKPDLPTPYQLPGGQPALTKLRTTSSHPFRMRCIMLRKR